MSILKEGDNVSANTTRNNPEVAWKTHMETAFERVKPVWQVLVCWLQMSELKIQS